MSERDDRIVRLPSDDYGEDEIIQSTSKVYLTTMDDSHIVTDIQVSPLPCTLDKYLDIHAQYVELIVLWFMLCFLSSQI